MARVKWQTIRETTFVSAGEPTDGVNRRRVWYALWSSASKATSNRTTACWMPEHPNVPYVSLQGALCKGVWQSRLASNRGWQDPLIIGTFNRSIPPRYWYKHTGCGSKNRHSEGAANKTDGTCGKVPNRFARTPITTQVLLGGDGWPEESRPT